MNAKDITVGGYVANTNPRSLYHGRPGLVIAEPRDFGDESDIRVRVAWIDSPTNVTVREPVLRILAPWEGDAPLTVDPAVIEEATQSYLNPFRW